MLFGCWHIYRCYSSAIHPTDAANAAGGFHDLCDTFDETLVIATSSSTSRVFGGFAGGSWAGVGHENEASDSFLMQLSPYPQRWETVGTNNFFNKIPNGWPAFGAANELRFGTNGPLGQGQNHPNYYAQCAAGSTYGTEANQPCGRNPGYSTWGETQMDVFYRCGADSGNGPCPWEPPPPPPVGSVGGMLLHEEGSGLVTNLTRPVWETSLESLGITGNWTTSG